MIFFIALLLVFQPVEPDCVPFAAAVWDQDPEIMYALRNVEGTDRQNPISSRRPQPWSYAHPWRIAGPWQVTHGRYGHFRAEILVSSMCFAAVDAAKYLHECRRICEKRYLECWHEGPSARFGDCWRWTKKVQRVKKALFP